MVKHNDAVHEKIKNHACSECDYAAYHKKALDYHMISAHGKGGKKLKCKKCSYSSALKNDLVRHNNSVHENIKNHACSECDYATYQKSNLKQHMESVHKEGGQGLKSE